VALAVQQQVVRLDVPARREGMRGEGRGGRGEERGGEDERRGGEEEGRDRARGYNTAH